MALLELVAQQPLERVGIVGDSFHRQIEPPLITHKITHGQDLGHKHYSCNCSTNVYMTNSVFINASLMYARKNIIAALVHVMNTRQREPPCKDA